MPVKTSQKFKILIERDEDGYFVATVTALPGCVTQAKTLPELTERVREAIKLCLEVAKTNVIYLGKTLDKIIKEARLDYLRGNYKTFTSAKELIAELRS